jgi:RNA recognition motif-containing protein
LVFKTKEICEANYAALQHKKLNDKKIFVDYCGTKSEYEKKLKEKDEKREKDMKRLHIGGFDKKTKEDELKKHVSNFTEFTMPIKKATNESFGFAFVQFKSEEDAKRQFEALNGKDLNGKKLKVEYAFVRVETKKPEPPAKKQKAENGAAVAAQPAKKEAKAEKKEVAEVKAKAPVAEVKTKAPVAEVKPTTVQKVCIRNFKAVS